MTVDLAVISGYFGAVSRLEVTPPGVGEPYFFANARASLLEAEALGWVPVDVSVFMPISSDELTSSIQSKWLKFLAFLPDFPEFSNRTIIYADHKNQLTKAAISKLLSSSGQQSKIVVRNHPEFRDNVMLEVAEAWRQPRYAQKMPETLEWIEERLAAGYKIQARVPNTGVILWPPTPGARAFASEMYEESVRLSQPECQVLWPIVSQGHRSQIRRIRYNALGIRPKRRRGRMRVMGDRLLLPLRRFLGRA